MKFFKVFLAILLLGGMGGPALSEVAHNNSGVNVIYLLDVSGSMNKGGLFANIKTRLKQLVQERKPGDRVVLITFGEDVWKVIDVEIRTPMDLKEIANSIDNLTANKPWTWMSKAFQRVKDIADDIRTKSPEKKTLIYLLTDCENDPPPAVKMQEPPWKFVEVLTKFFQDFQVKDTYIYLLAYRTLTEEEKGTIRKTAVQVQEPAAAQPLPLLVLEAKGFNFGKVDFAAGKATRAGEIIVKKIEGVPPGETVSISVPQELSVHPPLVICRVVNQKEKVALTLPAGLKPGEYSYPLKLTAPHAIVEPQEIKVSFTVPKPPEVVPSSTEPPRPPRPPDQNGLLWKILLGLLLLAGGIIFFRYIFKPPISRIVWIQPDEGEIHEAKVTPQKLWLGTHATQEHITLGLPHHYLVTEKGNVLLCEDTSGEKFRVRFDEEMPCKSKDGTIVKLRFFEQRPHAAALGGAEVEDRQPRGPMDTI